MAEINTNTKSVDYSLLSLPNEDVTETPSDSTDGPQLVRVANAALAAFVESFPDAGSAGPAATVNSAGDISSLITGNLDTDTLVSLSNIVLGEIDKSTRIGNAWGLRADSNHANEFSKILQARYEVVNEKLQRAAELAASDPKAAIALEEEAWAESKAIQRVDRKQQGRLENVQYDKLQTALTSAFGELIIPAVTSNLESLLGAEAYANLSQQLFSALFPGVLQDNIQDDAFLGFWRSFGDTKDIIDQVLTGLVFAAGTEAIKNPKNADIDPAVAFQEALASQVEDLSNTARALQQSDKTLSTAEVTQRLYDTIAAGIGAPPKAAGPEGLDELLAGDIDSETLQALVTILLNAIEKTQDSGKIKAIESDAEFKNEVSEKRQEHYEEINRKIQEALEKLSEAKALKIAGYALIAAGTALQAIPIVGNIAGAALIAAGAALLIAAKVIEDQANKALDEAAAASKQIQDAESKDKAADETAQFDQLQKVFTDLSAVSITTNVTAILNILGLGDLPNALAAVLEPALAETYTQQGQPPEEAAAKAKVDALATANTLTTVLVSVIALTALSGAQGDQPGATDQAQTALKAGLERAAEALTSLTQAEGTADAAGLGEAVSYAAGSAIKDHFIAETENLAAGAPSPEAARALQDAVVTEAFQIPETLEAVVLGLFQAQQTVQSGVVEFLADNTVEGTQTAAAEENPSLEALLAALEDLLAALIEKLGSAAEVTGETLTAEQQGALTLEQVPSRA